MDKYIVNLTKEERENLSSLTKTGKHAASKILHARILLACDEGDYADSGFMKTDEEVERFMEINKHWFTKEDHKFCEELIEAINGNWPQLPIGETHNYDDEIKWDLEV